MKTNTFFLTNNSEWAFITILEKLGVTVMIHSSFGNWAYTWGFPGEDKIKFLETADAGYTFNKFSNAMKLALPTKYEKRERLSYEDFYKCFWKLIIDELKKI